MDIRSEFKPIKERMVERLIASAKERAREGILVRPSCISEDFVPSPIDGGIRFANIDYDCKSRSGWAVSGALARAIELATYYLVTDCQDDGAFELINDILTDYAYCPYENPNWWHNEIGAPFNLSALLLMIGDKLDSNVFELLVKKIGRGAIADHPEIVTDYSGTHTGANLIWFCTISMRHAILTGDKEELEVAVKTVAKETYGSKEGLQSDGSFFQHGRRLYSFGYGRSYLCCCADVFYVVSGTSFAFPDFAYKNLVTHLLDGMRYMVGGEGIDYATTGREYVRMGALRAASIIPAVQILSECKEAPRQDEIKAFLEDLKAKRTPELQVKYFDVAKLLTARVGGVYFGFKGTDPTLVDAELVNGENALGYNLSYGTHTTFMRSGREYMDIAPLWDFNNIPGTTSPCEDDEALAAYKFGRSIATDDFGGMAEGDIGVCYLGVEHEGVRAVVSAFATPFGMVLLGAGLKDDADRPLHTTVEQNRYLGAHTVSEDGRSVVHGGILYRNLDDVTSFKIDTAEVERDYNRICTLSPHRMHKGSVFTITIPVEKSHTAYAYAVMPEEYSDSSVRVLVNNESVQAILLDDGRLIAVFHRECCIKLPDLGGLCGAKGEIAVINTKLG